MFQCAYMFSLSSLDGLDQQEYDVKKLSHRLQSGEPAGCIDFVHDMVSGGKRGGGGCYWEIRMDFLGWGKVRGYTVFFMEETWRNSKNKNCRIHTFEAVILVYK